MALATRLIPLPPFFPPSLLGAEERSRKDQQENNLKRSYPEEICIQMIITMRKIKKVPSDLPRANKRPVDGNNLDAPKGPVQAGVRVKVTATGSGKSTRTTTTTMTTLTIKTTTKKKRRWPQKHYTPHRRRPHRTRYRRPTAEDPPWRCRSRPRGTDTRALPEVAAGSDRLCA